VRPIDKSLSASKKIESDFCRTLLRTTLIVCIPATNMVSQHHVPDKKICKVSDRSSIFADIRAVFRLCSLWFNNPNNEAINEFLKKYIDKIPSHKFLLLFYQIASRMSAQENVFQHILTTLIKKVVMDHPHHSLYQIFALSNGNKVGVDQRGRDRYAKKIIQKIR
jgi:hypothetical protein